VHAPHNKQPTQAGITLIEMLVVVALIGLIAAVSFPAVSAGLDSIRIASNSDAIAAFLNSAVNRVERRQQPVEITIESRGMVMRSVEPGFERSLALPEGLRIAGGPRQAVIFPGGAIPRLTVELQNVRGSRRFISIDPITGVPQIRRPEEASP
jgi:prepilin-type N-terminal cleavage/methylation domain-containing protein